MFAHWNWIIGFKANDRKKIANDCFNFFINVDVVFKSDNKIALIF